MEIYMNITDLFLHCKWNRWILNKKAKYLFKILKDLWQKLIMKKKARCKFNIFLQKKLKQIRSLQLIHNFLFLEGQLLLIIIGFYISIIMVVSLRIKKLKIKKYKETFMMRVK